MVINIEENNTTSLWHDIKGSNQYQISVTGQVRKKLKNNRYRTIKGYRRKNKWLAIKIEIDGVYKERYVHHIMGKTFIDQFKEGHVLRFKNGDITDPALINLEYIDAVELGRMTGAMSRRMPVAKLSNDNEVVQVYPSARVAARQNYMSYQTICDRCNKKVKSKLAPDGYMYVWDKDVNY